MVSQGYAQGISPASNPDISNILDWSNLKVAFWG